MIIVAQNATAVAKLVILLVTALALQIIIAAAAAVDAAVVVVETMEEEVVVVTGAMAPLEETRRLGKLITLFSDIMWIWPI